MLLWSDFYDELLLIFPFELLNLDYFFLLLIRTAFFNFRLELMSIGNTEITDLLCAEMFLLETNVCMI